MNYIILVVIGLIWITGMSIYITRLTQTNHQRVIEFITLVFSKFSLSAFIKAWRKKDED